MGASVAYNLAQLGARDVVLADRGRVAGGSTSKAMGGVRQQFSSAAEVRLAQESIAFFEELGAETLVMVADPDYVAIRVYRSVGFDGTETQLQATRLPATP